MPLQHALLPLPARLRAARGGRVPRGRDGAAGQTRGEATRNRPGAPRARLPLSAAVRRSLALVVPQRAWRRRRSAALFWRIRIRGNALPAGMGGWSDVAPGSQSLLGGVRDRAPLQDYR